MSETACTLSRVPDHVPAELVHQFYLPTLPGADVDPVQAVVDGIAGKPDIFYGVGDPNHPGAWFITPLDLVREAYQRSEDFSSAGAVNFAGLVGESWPLRPLELDPPGHAQWRALLEPMFAPARIRALEADIGELAGALVEGLVPTGGCDFMHDFAAVFPIQIFLRLIDLPLDKTPDFLDWEEKLIHAPTMAGRAEGARQIVAYLRKVIAERRINPGADVLSIVVNSQIDGRAMTDDEAIGVAMLLYSAGLDTVTSMLCFVFRHLAEHPADQQRLRDHPEQIPHALEEMIRAYSTVPSSRLVAGDFEFHGVRMKKGDKVTLLTMAADRDPREFDSPDAVDFDRENVSHIAFAAGRHRCAGSHLARRELRVAIEEWLKRVPPFRIADGQQAKTQAVGVFGFTALPLAW